MEELLTLLARSKNRTKCDAIHHRIMEEMLAVGITVSKVAHGFFVSYIYFLDARDKKSRTVYWIHNCWYRWKLRYIMWTIHVIMREKACTWCEEKMALGNKAQFKKKKKRKK